MKRAIFAALGVLPMVLACSSASNDAAVTTADAASVWTVRQSDGNVAVTVVKGNWPGAIEQSRA